MKAPYSKPIYKPIYNHADLIRNGNWECWTGQWYKMKGHDGSFFVILLSPMRYPGPNVNGDSYVKPLSHDGIAYLPKWWTIG